MSGLIVLLIIWFIILSIFAGFIVLQIFLSKRENKGVGLILPIVSFVMALSIISGVSMYTAQPVVTSSEDVVIEKYNGETVVIEDEEYMEENSDATTGVIYGLIVVFVMFNIPTAVYLTIYFVCRSKKRRIRENSQQKQLEKMSIQDLG